MNSIILQVFQHQQKIIKLLIIVGVLTLSLLIGRVIPAKYLAYVLVLIVAFGVFLVYIRHPQLGLLAVVAGGMLVNFELGTSTSTSINLAVILLPLSMGVWFVDRFVRQHQVRFISSRTNPPLIALVIISLLAFGIGQLNMVLLCSPGSAVQPIGRFGNIHPICRGVYLHRECYR